MVYAASTVLLVDAVTDVTVCTGGEAYFYATMSSLLLQAFDYAPLPFPQPRVLNRVRRAVRARHLSLRTERAYVQWIKRFILHHGTRHPEEMGAPEIQSFSRIWLPNGTRGSLHAEPGPQRAAVPLSRGAWPRPRRAGKYRLR